MNDKKIIKSGLTKNGEEREREYGNNQKQKECKCLDNFISSATHAQLDKIAELKGMSAKDVLVALIDSEYRAMLLDQSNVITPNNANFDSFVELINQPQEATEKSKETWKKFFEDNKKNKGLFDDFNPRD